MKNIYTYLELSMIVLLTSCISSKNYAQSYSPESPAITYQQFYDGLSPYGNWVDYQNYGYVWVPNEQGFRPYYTNGHWVYTNYGWTWVSNYNWGWAPFHYGSWLYDDAYGWMWVPGYEWAPAWVSWRSGGGCYGWAPLGPDFNMGIGIPYRYWAFVPHRYINSPRINNYYINREKNITIINNTTVINNTKLTLNKTVYVTGPSAIEVEKVTNQKIRPVKIVQKNTPGNTEVSGSAVSIYKPAVRETPKENEQIKPSRIINLNELKVRHENAGAVQNEIPGKAVQGKPETPIDKKPEPVLKSEKINNIPSANEKENPVIEKPNPIIEKQVQAQQPQKIIPDQKIPDLKPENINREKNNDPQTQNTQQDNTINKQPAVINNPPAVINNQPEKVKEINQPNKNSENIRQNIPPAPVNSQPIETQQINTVRRQHIPSPGNKQVNGSPVNHTPKIRNQNRAEPRSSHKQAPERVRK